MEISLNENLKFVGNIIWLLLFISSALLFGLPGLRKNRREV